MNVFSVFMPAVLPGVDLAEGAGVLVESSSPGWIPWVAVAALVVGLLSAVVASFSKEPTSLMFPFLFGTIISGLVFLLVGFLSEITSLSHVDKMNQIEAGYDVTFRTAEGDPWTDSDSREFLRTGDISAVTFTHGDSELQGGFLMAHPHKEDSGTRYVLVTGVDGLVEFSPEDAE